MIRLRFCIVFLVLIQPLFSQSQTIISGGMSHTMYLCDNGKIFTWGDNNFGQLGRNPELNEDINPVAIPTLKDVVAISGGEGYFSMAVRKDSSVWTWGQNSQLQLGTDTFCTTAELCEYWAKPVQVKGGETGTYFLHNAISCSAGLTQSYALLSTGEVVAWGDNYHGQMGNGNTIRQQFPVYVKISETTNLTNIKAISAGAMFCYALTKDGKVWGWGKNSEFELACGNSQDQYFATPILDINGNQLSDIVSISAGYKHALCLSSTGIVYGCGSYKGETVINGTTFYTIQSYAEEFTSITNATAISSGFTHNLALVKTANGQKAVSWGNNKYFPISTKNYGGQLGIGDTSITHSTTPQTILSTISDPIDSVKWIAATTSNSFLFTENSKTGATTLFGTGINDAGQLGARDHNDRYFAIKIIIPACNANCPTAFLGDNEYLCSPIIDTLSSSYVNPHFLFKWYKNDVIIPSEKESNLAISSQGKYTVEIIDTVKGCDAVADEITIKQKKNTFSILDATYCGDSITFKTFNNQSCNWYSKKIFGEYLGHGSTISVASASLTTTLPDSSKTIWMFTQECQPMPDIAKKNCSACTILAPIVNVNTENCLFSNVNVQAIGNNIRWYKNGSSSIYSLSNKLTIDSSITASYLFQVTQSDTICESKPTSVQFSVAKCTKKYSVSGSLIPAQKGLIIIYNFNSLPNIIDQKNTDSIGNYSFVIPDNSNILIFGRPDVSGIYEPTYFGNTTDISRAYPLLVDANIGSANITLQTKTGNTEITRQVSVYPTIVTSFCRITIPHTNPFKISVFNTIGIEIYSVLSNEESTVIDTSKLTSGLYFIKITSDSDIYQTKSFVKE